MQTKKQIVVAGAGLVGCLLSLMLRKKGFDVKVLEKRPDIRKNRVEGDRSINLVITAKGLNGLNELGLAREMLKISSPVSGRMMHSQTGELTYQPYGRDEYEVNYAISRSKLNQFLLEQAEKAGVEFYFDTELAGVDPKNKAVLADGKNIFYGVLFGADGIGSAVRKEMEVIEGSSTRSTIEPLGIHYKEMLMPASASGDFPFRGDCLHIWPRGDNMLMSLPNIDHTFALILCMPPKDFEQLNSREAVAHYFTEKYPDSISRMPGYVDDFEAHPTSMLGTLRCKNWFYEDHICLVGDAAHAIVPFFGQGTNCGFDDVSRLSWLIEEDGDNFGAIFEKYYASQKPAADAIADMSIENYNVMSAKVADPKFLLQKRIERKLEKEFPNEYRSRYGMVTYTLIPYDRAKEAGEIQKEILNNLCSDIASEDQLDLNLAKQLLFDRLTPFLKNNSLSLSRFTL